MGSYLAYGATTVKSAGFDEAPVTYKIHIDRGWHHSVIPCIPPVAPIERSSSSDVIDNSSEDFDPPPLFFSRDGRTGVRSGVFMRQQIIVLSDETEGQGKACAIAVAS